MKTQTSELKLFHSRGISKNSFVFNSRQVRLTFSSQSKDLFIHKVLKKWKSDHFLLKYYWEEVSRTRGEMNICYCRSSYSWLEPFLLHFSVNNLEKIYRENVIHYT